MKASSLLGSLAAAGLFVTTHAQAQMLSHDSFSYAAGSTLAGQNGGTGFGAAYTANGAGLTTAAAGLTYTDANGKTLPAAGNAAALAGGNAGVFRTLSSTLGGGNGTVWVSFLEQVNGTTGYAGLSLFTGTGGTEHVFFGSGGAGGLPAINLESTGPGTGTGETALTTTGFVVAELQFGTAAAGGSGVTVRLFDNPTLGTQPATANLTESNATSFTFDTIRIQSGSDTGSVDEVRLGDTFADVAPVPEPTTTALSLLGGAGMLGFIIRRRVA